ncbi:MAG: hypothetical protein JWO03_3409 [Bacteroidetes bacterium]|nr:hypothetical protein [Bacteroidota bacterium]
MRTGALLLSLLFWQAIAVAQTSDFSAPTRMSAKLNRVRIIGKNQDGYVVRFSGNEELIHVYDNEMKLACARTLDFKGGDGSLQQILLNKTGASLIYLHTEKKQTLLMMQPVNSKYIEQGKPLVVDTFDDRHDLVDNNLHFKISLDQNYMLFYYPVFEGGRIKSMQMTCIDRAATVVYKTYVPINRPEKDMEYAKALVDNAGNGYLIFTAEKNGKDNVYGDDYFVTRIDKTDGKQTSYTIKCEKEIFGEPQFEMDNVNGALVFCGFYDEKGDPADAAANGFFFLRYDAPSGVVKQSSYTPFPASFMSSLTGRDAAGMSNRLFTFNIRKALLRLDGGALITAESVITDKREVVTMSPSTMSTPYNTYRTVYTFAYNDIIAFSFKPDGTIDWDAVMRKKQLSEEDAGFNSSFAFINEKDKVHFLYLDEISTGGSLNEYKLTSKGTTERVILFGQEEKDVYIIPKLGKQVAPNELVIPSVKNGSFRLVRVQY